MTDDGSALIPGYRIDRYELLYAVARGGMGAVWAGRLKRGHGFEKVFAVKTILPKFASEPVFRAMFLDEGLIASAIIHPNVAQVFDLGEHNGMLYMVMEWVDGDSLQRLIRAVEGSGSAIPLGIVLRVLADACAGLHAAHELRDRAGRLLDVVHRDVSPANILVSAGGVGKLIDFGVVKARNRVAGETNDSAIKGKVRFMAPEQFLRGQVDRRADLFSVCAILFRVVTGRQPFPGDTDFEIIASVLGAAGPPAAPPNVPAPLAGLFERGLTPDPTARFSTALELQAAIEAVAVELGVVTSQASVGAYLRAHTLEDAERRQKAFDMAVHAIEQIQLVGDALPPESSSPFPVDRKNDSIPVFAEAPTTATAAAFDTSPPRRGHRGALALGAALLLAATAATVLFARESHSRGAPGSSAAVVATTPPAGDPKSDSSDVGPRGPTAPPSSTVDDRVGTSPSESLTPAAAPPGSAAEVAGLASATRSMPRTRPPHDAGTPPTRSIDALIDSR
jgi:serine/threonine-protein kinase